jgi:hypothetical protein
MKSDKQLCGFILIQNMKFNFLFENNTAEGKYFTKQYNDLKSKNDSSIEKAFPHSSVQQTHLSSVTPAVEPPQILPDTGRKRNRWGPAPADSIGTKHTALPENMDAAALKQLRDQKQMQLLHQRALEGIARGNATDLKSDLMGLHEERIKSYSGLMSGEDAEKDTIEDAEYTGGVIEGGTWEHRKRAKEMLETAERALQLTASAHVLDSLPKEQLDAFLKNKVSFYCTVRYSLNCVLNFSAPF